MNNLTIIIPIHEYDNKIKDFLDKALESIIKQKDNDGLPKVIIVYSKDIKENINTIVFNDDTNSKLEISFLINEDKTDYQSQVNLAVKSVTTEYFSVLEFDDQYSMSYFKNVKKYTDYYKDIDIFLPIIIEVNDKNESIKLTNEGVWAQQFVGENGESGYLNMSTLNQYTDFKLSGAIIKKSEFINIGGFKVNIELTFMYEFLLRALNSGCKVFTIPKISYKHLANRENSLFGHYLKDMSPAERNFWFETAKKEYNYSNDRNIDKTKINKSIIFEK